MSEDDRAISALRKELQSVGAIAFDLDGVLYEGDTPIPGAVQAVGAVRDAGLAVCFVTNTTSLSRRLIAAKLARFGFSSETSHVFCLARAAAAWLRQERATAALFVPDAALEDFDGVAADDERPDAVVIGDLELRPVEPRVSSRARAGRAAHRSGPHALLEGPSEPAFFAALAEDIGQPADRIAMVGDDIVTDVAAEMHAGLVGVLVRTGKFHPRDLEGTIRPDLVIESVARIIED
jgi:ribonucleotide monophosphatase NagD (HAD superfamily)